MCLPSPIYPTAVPAIRFTRAFHSTFKYCICWMVEFSARPCVVVMGLHVFVTASCIRFGRVGGACQAHHNWLLGHSKKTYLYLSHPCYPALQPIPPHRPTHHHFLHPPSPPPHRSTYLPTHPRREQFLISHLVFHNEAREVLFSPILSR